jgi:hypothetical protein
MQQLKNLDSKRSFALAIEEVVKKVKQILKWITQILF